MPMEDRDIAGVAQIAARLQRRLNHLTSTWPGSLVDVHRLQETVSRACTVLQSSLQSQSGTRFGRSFSEDSYRGPVDRQLSSHLAFTRKVLGDLTDILYVNLWCVSLFSIIAGKFYGYNVRLRNQMRLDGQYSPVRGSETVLDLPKT